MPVNFSQDLLAMSGVELRQKYPDNPVAQGKEHGGYVEDILNSNPSLIPVLAPLGAIAIPLYQLAKTTELGRNLVKTTDEPASKPSVEQMVGGYEGLGRGIMNHLSKEALEFMGVEVTK